MAPLIVLLATFLLAYLTIRMIRKESDLALAARIAISVMLLFTSLGHFMYTKGMAMMMPDFIPYKTGHVYATGVIEILAAIGLQVRRFRVPTAWLLILFFVVVLSANINAAMKGINYQKGTFDGEGPGYLWFRVPLQILFMAWSYISSIKYGQAIKRQPLKAHLGKHAI